MPTTADLPSSALSSPAEETSAEEKHELANQWTQRGIRLMESSAASGWIEALRCFDQAIRLRQSLPLHESPWYRWGLTAGWMNRASALSRLGREDEALAAYEQALVHLQRLPLDQEPAFRWRLGLAWMNRALSLHAQGRGGEAEHSMERSIQELDHPQLKTPRDLGTLGCAWMNRAVLLLECVPSRPLDALSAACRALALLVPLERQDILAAEGSLKARHRACQAVAELLETPPLDIGKADEWILSAADQVEEALALAEYWQDGADFSEITRQLFRFGCRIYLAYQPHFLGEFMLDVLRPRPGRAIHAGLYVVAEESLRHAAEVLRQRGPVDFGLKRVDDLLRVLERLDAAARQIRAWRPAETILP